MKKLFLGKKPIKHLHKAILCIIFASQQYIYQENTQKFKNYV